MDRLNIRNKLDDLLPADIDATIVDRLVDFVEDEANVLHRQHQDKKYYVRVLDKESGDAAVHSFDTPDQLREFAAKD